MTMTSEPTTGTGDASGVLRKVRSLLAKAESTTFPDEAEALTAKAQELMDRHAIDRAMVAEAGGCTSGPEGRSVTIDAPYGREKYLLLAATARANRSRAVYRQHEGVATVIGFPEDQETIELLYTSLLLQATSTMLANGDRASTRTRRYRQSFLVAFASRIGERLAEADAAVVADADRAHGGGVLPVLASRADQVEERLAHDFPHLQNRRVVVRDAVGWGHGRAAAERARLGRDASLRRDPRPGLGGG
ncbi:MAG: DUF2786 domain-containing protein [Acidimicrobiales bacterium]|nr:DUF2786 domain-containing protein [Acidimicrobiales bacterium]